MMFDPVDRQRTIRTGRPGALARRRVVGLFLLIMVPASVSANTDVLIGVALFSGIGAVGVGVAWYYIDGGIDAPPNDTRSALMLGGVIAIGIATVLTISSIGKSGEALDMIEQMSVTPTPSLEQMPSLEQIALGQIALEQVIEKEEEG